MLRQLAPPVLAQGHEAADVGAGGDDGGVHGGLPDRGKLPAERKLGGVLDVQRGPVRHLQAEKHGSLGSQQVHAVNPKPYTLAETGRGSGCAAWSRPPPASGEAWLVGEYSF